MEFGIYIAKFKNSLYNKKYGKDILGSYVIGETNLSANRYSNFEEVESIVKNRILDEARKNNGKKGFANEIKNWDKDVLEFEFLTLSSEKKNIDDRIRAKLENFNVGIQIKGTEFFKTNLNAKQLKEKILESEVNPCNFQRTLTYNQNGFRRDIINKAENILNKYHEVLLYLFCRVGKSAISLQIASEVSNTKHILIVTAFPNAKNSFKEYTVNHKNMIDYYFYDKDNLTDFNSSYNNVTFLSTAALRVKEDEEDVDVEDKEIIYKRINELKQKGFNPDVLIIDETHNGISSPNTDKVINTLKETFSIKNIIHNSATPFNDFKSGRFEKEQTIQYDFLTLKLNNFVNYPNLEMISLPYYKDEKDFVNILVNSKLKGDHKILFMETVDQARRFVETYKENFRKKKIEIEYIDDIEKGISTEDKTNNFQNQFEKTIVVTVNKLTTGVTLPKTDAVVLAKNIKSSERLIQIMSRSLTKFEGKDSVYFYTIGSDNTYIALDETRRSYNIANDNEEIDAFAESLKRGFLKVSEAVFENGDDLNIHELGINNIMSNVREWSCNLSNISNQLLIDINIDEDQIRNFNTFSSSGLTKVANTLKLIQEEGTRKIKNTQNTLTEDFCQKLKDKINLNGNKIEKKEIEKNITIDELIRNWFMCIISSLNTWLLTKEINSFEEIAEHVSTKYELDNIQKVVFEKILSDNENLIKERIVDFNALFFKFNDMSLMEQSKKSKVLRDLLNPEISKLVQNNKAGAGYPKEVLEDMTKGIDLNSKDIAILDDLDLSMTNYLINTLNINESCIYLICSNEESYEIMEKSYNIRGGHLLKMEDIVNENLKKNFDIVIMNPPYGKRSSLAQKIIYHIFKFSLKIVVLAPPNTYKNFALLEYIQSIKRVNSNIFKDALIYNLCIGEINKSLGPFKNFPSLILSEKNLKLYEKIQFYNGNHSTSFKVEKDFLNCEKDWNKMFAFSYAIDNGGTDITPWNKKIDLTNYKEKHQGPTADIKFNFGNNFKSYYNNLKGNISFPRLINMHSPLERNNFSNWYYKAGKLANTIRYIISQCENITPKTQCYITYFPNLDWTRSWTDEEILEEIGLPRNFLNDIN